ncbi:MAG: saccharopine dehydrogenase NADP-binding domain-containing protein [Bacteroidales bacterium]|nr:saccharopine dehydrogenase NADP-binding domain-containing protein [Bacteroidales bacterium]
MRILVLGAGLVGGPIAADLAKEPANSITVADIDPVALEKLSAKHKVTTLRVDLSDSKMVRKLSAGFELVVSAVPGFLGHQTLKAVIEAGTNVVDITFAPEDFQLLDAFAKEKNVTAICDMGVAPGMSNLLAAHCVRFFDKADDLKIYVGGLPKERPWPYEYKAVFSPIDVIEEYTRPARFRKNGKEVIMPALTDVEPMYVEGFGDVESFNSDGLRSLLTSIPDVPNMIEKTLRYPGHVEKMRILRETGFFRTDTVMIDGNPIRPIDMTAKLLFPMIKLQEGEEDITVMLIIAEGLKDNQRKRITYTLIDNYDKVTGVHSMARTTGYAASMAARLLIGGLYKNPGINTPEALVDQSDVLPFLLKGLEERGVVYQFKEEVID